MEAKALSFLGEEEACREVDLTTKVTHDSSHLKEVAPTLDLSSRCAVLEECVATEAQSVLLLNEVNSTISRVGKEADMFPTVAVMTTGAPTTTEEVATTIMIGEGTEKQAATRLFRSLVVAAAVPVPVQTLKQLPLCLLKLQRTTTTCEQARSLKSLCERLPPAELFKPLGSTRK